MRNCSCCGETMVVKKEDEASSSFSNNSQVSRYDLTMLRNQFKISCYRFAAGMGECFYQFHSFILAI